MGQLREYEEWKEEILSLPPDERKHELFWISMLWESDWGFFSAVYICQGMSSDEIQEKHKEYFENCRKTLLEDFDYEPYF